MKALAHGIGILTRGNVRIMLYIRELGQFMRAYLTLKSVLSVDKFHRAFQTITNKVAFLLQYSHLRYVN